MDEKTLHMNDRQFSLLQEARMDGFRIDALRNMNYTRMVDYCRQWLGNEIGGGSSRIVFQLDDNTVLKLAKNEKGLAQNEKEYDLSNDWYIGYMFPEVKNGSDEENFKWIVSEFVLPATAQDFKKLLGVPFKVVQEGLSYIGNYNKNWRSYQRFIQEHEDNEKLVEFLEEVLNFANCYDIFNQDYTRIANWGLCNRGGEAVLKMLDYGLDEEIFDKYYRIRR